jgi:hypothetical protein
VSYIYPPKDLSEQQAAKNLGHSTIRLLISNPEIDGQKENLRFSIEMLVDCDRVIKKDVT